MELASHYWPATKDLEDQEPGPEARRLGELWNRELARIDRWWGLLDELRKEFPQLTVGDATATPDACFRCAVYAPVEGDPSGTHRLVVGCVSILAPVYTVYGMEYERIQEGRRNPRVSFEPLPEPMRSLAKVISSKLEATFGVSALPREVAQMPVPLVVQWKEPPEATLFHALFTSEPQSVP
jgi:hypothetical protein